MQSSSRNGYRVRVLCLHTTEGIMRAEQLRAWTSWPGSSHASADETGVLLSGSGDGFVDYERASWTLRSGNPWSENIELCGWARWTPEEWMSRPRLLDACAKWLADRSKARGIPLVRLTPQQYRAGASGVIDHYTHTVGYLDGTHTDVGKGFPWDHVLALARDYAGGIQFDSEDDMFSDKDREMLGALVYALIPDGGLHEPAGAVINRLGSVQYALGPEDGFTSQGEVTKRLRAVHGLVSDPAAFAAALAAHLGKNVDQATVEAGVRAVLGGLDQ